MGSSDFSVIGYIINIMRFYIASFLLTVFVAYTTQDELPYEYQTNYDAYYNQDVQQQGDAIDFLSQQGLIKDKQDLFGGMDMTMVSMGASVASAVVALGALAYALTLEAKILTNDARSSSTCSALNTITSASLSSISSVTTSDCTWSTTDADQTEANLVACINVAVSDINTKLVTAINTYGNPTC